jgi:NitT/TauT family transport system ATP-binding protein
MPGLSLELSAVRRTFAGGVAALEGVDLACAAGEFVALLGPSGCGKSTLLRIAAGLDVADSGTVARGGDQLAFVFQDAHLLPWRDVLGNVALPLELAGVAAAERADRARDALTQVGLADAATRLPSQLSGGMRMRASLARAMVTRPGLLLLDEPFAALDELGRQHLDDVLRTLWRVSGMTILFVTHSVAEAAYLADRAVVFTKRPARIVLDHKLALPAERSVALRDEPEFARETRILRSALEKGSA